MKLVSTFCVLCVHPCLTLSIPVLSRFNNENQYLSMYQERENSNSLQNRYSASKPNINKIPEFGASSGFMRKRWNYFNKYARPSWPNAGDGERQHGLENIPYLPDFSGCIDKKPSYYCSAYILWCDNKYIQKNCAKTCKMPVCQQQNRIVEQFFSGDNDDSDVVSIPQPFQFESQLVDEYGEVINVPHYVVITGIGPNDGGEAAEAVENVILEPNVVENGQGLVMLIDPNNKADFQEELEPGFQPPNQLPKPANRMQDFLNSLSEESGENLVENLIFPDQGKSIQVFNEEYENINVTSELDTNPNSVFKDLSPEINFEDDILTILHENKNVINDIMQEILKSQEEQIIDINQQSAQTENETENETETETETENQNDLSSALMEGFTFLT